MAIVRWEPFRDLSELNRLFATGGAQRSWLPAMDLTETTDEFVLTADLPGLGEDDVKIELVDRVLTVSGERTRERTDDTAGYRRVERAYGSFRRSLTLPRASTARRSRRASTAACSRSGSRSPSSASRAPSRSRRRRPSRRRTRGGGASVAAPVFSIRTKDPGSYARTGTLKLAHGEVRTPAFVPLATKAVVKTLEVREAGALGFDMVLGNTFHLFLTPGHELIAKLGGLHSFQRWDRPIITDSGGFQVFSMGHGTVADEIKGRAAQLRRRALGRDPVDRGGRRPVPLLSRRRDEVHGARDVNGGPGRAGVGHRARVRRVHAVPRRPRLHGAVDRAHAPLARPLPRLALRAWPRRAGRLRDRAGRGRGGPAARVGTGGGRTRRVRDRDRRHARRGQGADVRGRGVDDRGTAGGEAAPPARDRRGRRSRARRRARDRHVRLRDADPDRPARHGDRARSSEALAGGSGQGALEGVRRAAARRLPVPGLRGGLHPRVPALPVQGQGADRDAAAHDPQPGVPAAVDGGAARRDRRGAFGGGRRRGARWSRAMGVAAAA